MRFALTGLFVAGLMPLVLAWRAHRATSLAHALVWAMVAWLSWAAALLLDGAERTNLDPWRYGALCLTGCAGIAVLGARRPHVFAWNFVVLGLFAVMLLPLVETLLIGTQAHDTLRIVFLSATIAVGVLNYLPTRFAPAALLLAIACSGEIVRLFASDQLPGDLCGWIVDGLLAAVPFVAWSCVRKHNAALSDADRLWLDFRDAWGLLWSQRVREQFNRAMDNAGCSATLTWRGVRSAGDVDEARMLDTLRASLQRFVEADQRNQLP
jgi:hypothetical protein